MRLGFPVRAFGLHSDGEGTQASGWGGQVAHLRDLALYLQANDIHMYRLDARLVEPFAERFGSLGGLSSASWDQEIAFLRGLFQEGDVRLSFHAQASVILNTPDEGQLLEAVGRLSVMAQLLEALGQGGEGVIVLHVGGVYGDAARSLERFARRYGRLPAYVRERLGLENDDRSYGHAQVRKIHEMCGIPLVFDNLHHAVLGGCPEVEALEYSLKTWPEGVTPKVHYSTPRSEVRSLGRGGLAFPHWREHADLVNPFEFARFVQQATHLRAFDLMLEARARDLALLHLREDLSRYAPEVRARCS